MKNIAICYGEHAIKVSVSYCSGPSSNQAYSSSHLTPSIQNAVTCIYKVKLSTEKQFLIRLTWCNLLNKGFSIGICDYPFSTSEFSKSFRIRHKERGTKTFESGSLRMEVFWDLCRAKYDSGPEPITGFYVVILVNSELSLILGDMEQELEVKKRISDIQVSEFSLISRSEHFSGNAVYSTRAKFCDTGTCHDILIKCFGGDQTTLNNLTYLPTSGYAVFLFRTRRGLDSRLWLEEKSFEQNEQEKRDEFNNT
ncbi:hypothetical protein Pfo_028504 [Paulownia fortunei]|nr:hypothetical protein Pfo_028504 [Paulownia fortunei]